MTRNKLYTILTTACIAGYVWLAYTYYRQALHLSETGVCIFKHVTTIPCPACGSTRSVLQLIKGDIAGAIYWNPFGLLLMVVLAAAPFWMITDVITRKESLLNAYLKGEELVRRRWIAIPAIVILILNWIWNINKGL